MASGLASTCQDAFDKQVLNWTYIEAHAMDKSQPNHPKGDSTLPSSRYPQRVAAHHSAIMFEPSSPPVTAEVEKDNRKRSLATRQPSPKTNPANEPRQQPGFVTADRIRRRPASAWINWMVALSAASARRPLGTGREPQCHCASALWLRHFVIMPKASPNTSKSLIQYTFSLLETL